MPLRLREAARDALANPQILTAALPEGRREPWSAVAGCLGYPFAAGTEFETFLGHASRIASRYMTSEMKALCRSLRTRRGPAAVLFQGMPLDSVLPAPPADGARPAGKQAVSEAAILGVACRLGEVFSYRQENNGALCHEVAPVPGHETSNSSIGEFELAPHSDVAAAPDECTPEFLALLGLINEDRAETVLHIVDEVVCKLPDEHLECLARPEFRFRYPESFRIPGGPAFSPPRPIIGLRRRRLTIASSSSEVIACTADGERSLEFFRALLCGMPGHRFPIAPGDLIIFNNRRVLHSRTAFTGSRWLQRVYVRTDLGALRRITASRNGERVFDATRFGPRASAAAAS